MLAFIWIGTVQFNWEAEKSQGFNTQFVNKKQVFSELNKFLIKWGIIFKIRVCVSYTQEATVYDCPLHEGLQSKIVSPLNIIALGIKSSKESANLLLHLSFDCIFIIFRTITACVHCKYFLRFFGLYSDFHFVTNKQQEQGCLKFLSHY